MGKQNTPLILGFVNNAARNTFNVSQKQVQNKNVQQKAVKQQKPQQQDWTNVNKKTNKKGTQSFQSWADVASRNTKSELQKTSWANVVKQQEKTQQRSVKPQQQAKQQQAKPVQKQQQKQQKQQQQQLKNTKSQQTQTWGWYPASKQEAELKKLNQRNEKSVKQANNKVQNKQQNKQQGKQQNKPQGKQQNKQQLMKQQKMRNAKLMMEKQANKREQEMKKNFNLLKNINNLYDAFNLRLPSENSRGAWISSNKVGSDKVLSVATLYAIRNAPSTRGKKCFVQRNGQIIFNNKCIRRAVEGRFTGHKKFRGNRVLTYIPEKWLSQDNGYSKGANYEKFASINGPKRNERCYSFKGVY
ncbi:hypothetical protein BCR36DRAFT_583884 [Piromyces finnis]|uniref:Uncharacterized protein n=1 Tax=Piromyces finnis TaxID=1754191 RepID=A0A1Y1V7Y1_9FUNG|nr:hypothetical protein BCR36DRAFT_583884 [Piromyces finnis]|eukprot:ORX49290.1 hypothetical protein BCR36DRAFT_583884 [Piromyces finnis]